MLFGETKVWYKKNGKKERLFYSFSPSPPFFSPHLQTVTLYSKKKKKKKNERENSIFSGKFQILFNH